MTEMESIYEMVACPLEIHGPFLEPAGGGGGQEFAAQLPPPRWSHHLVPTVHRGASQGSTGLPAV